MSELTTPTPETNSNILSASNWAVAASFVLESVGRAASYIRVHADTVSLYERKYTWHEVLGQAGDVQSGAVNSGPTLMHTIKGGQAIMHGDNWGIKEIIIRPDANPDEVLGWLSITADEAKKNWETHL